jgi:uncharacterized Rossmann fold enzyme
MVGEAERGREPVQAFPERVVLKYDPPTANLSSLDEAGRVVAFILDDEVTAIAGSVARDASTAENLIRALTIAVDGAVRAYVRRSFVVDCFGDSDPEVKRAVARHRKRRVGAVRAVCDWSSRARPVCAMGRECLLRGHTDGHL